MSGIDETKGAETVAEPRRRAAATTAPETPAPAAGAPESDAGDETTADPKAAHYDSLIRSWVFDNLHGGHIGRSKECWEELQGALPALRDVLLKGE